MKIKRYCMLALLVLSSLGTVFAQRDSTKTQYLFKGDGKIHSIGVYIAPEFRYGSLAGSFAPMMGGSAMLLINKKFGIGLAGYSTMQNYTPSKLNGLAMNSHFGGVKLEYTPHPNRMIHVSYGIIGGMGSAHIDSARGNMNNFNNGGGPGFGNRDRNGNDHDGLFGGGRGHNFAVFEPSVSVEANLFRFAKLFGSVSYRLTTGGSNIPSPLTNSDVSGVNVSVGVKVGFFDLPIHHYHRRKV